MFARTSIYKLIRKSFVLCQVMLKNVHFECQFCGFGQVLPFLGRRRPGLYSSSEPNTLPLDNTQRQQKVHQNGPLNDLPCEDQHPAPTPLAIRLKSETLSNPLRSFTNSPNSAAQSMSLALTLPPRSSLLALTLRSATPKPHSEASRILGIRFKTKLSGTELKEAKEVGSALVEMQKAVAKNKIRSYVISFGLGSTIVYYGVTRLWLAFGVFSLVTLFLADESAGVDGYDQVQGVYRSIFRSRERKWKEIVVLVAEYLADKENVNEAAWKEGRCILGLEKREVKTAKAAADTF
ncbi:hypothetical protein BJ508DRAFT_303225 [Ascobolus immersus RN42]|uniref:Uncharacterized protein n=1 Tax=Ascobolus immersus RN42 TaxID=1160509 RepID=A0A3N4IGA6_ASCIM|nr:hypothetical protein BJ508DRAFT_303225 [Ascobolus immersus RN42]